MFFLGGFLQYFPRKTDKKAKFGNFGGWGGPKLAALMSVVGECEQDVHLSDTEPVTEVVALPRVPRQELPPGQSRRHVSRARPPAIMACKRCFEFCHEWGSILKTPTPTYIVPPSSQSLAVKEFRFMARGISRGFFVKVLAPTFLGN